MKLQEYLEKYGIKNNFFAEKVGTSPQTIDRLINAGYLPSLKLAIAIEKETKNKVNLYKDWDLSKGAKCEKPKNTYDKESCNSHN